MKSEKHGTQRTGLNAVLDTNVYVSMFARSDGRLSGLWRQAIAGDYRIITSPAIVGELGRILRGRFAWTEAAVRSQLKLLAHVSLVVVPDSVPNAVPDDPDDNHVIACALTGNADLIVSGDNDLLRLKEYRGIPIVRPMDFLRTLGSR